jgi:hypothetical protein
MYEFTTELASFEPPKPEQTILLSSLIGNQFETDRFFGVLTGAVPMRDYFAPGNLVKIIGFRGVANIMLSKIRSPRPRSPVEESPAGEENQAPAA